MENLEDIKDLGEIEFAEHVANEIKVYLGEPESSVYNDELMITLQEILENLPIRVEGDSDYGFIELSKINKFVNHKQDRRATSNVVYGKDSNKLRDILQYSHDEEDNLSDSDLAWLIFINKRELDAKHFTIEKLSKDINLDGFDYDPDNESIKEYKERVHDEPMVKPSVNDYSINVIDVEDNSTGDTKHYWNGHEVKLVDNKWEYTDVVDPVHENINLDIDKLFKESDIRFDKDGYIVISDQDELNNQLDKIFMD